MKRKIVNINKELCNGCGICINACHEAAIVLKDGKAELLNDIYCDGLGDCLSGCPTGAITIIEREAQEYDDDAVKQRVDKLKSKNNTMKSMNLGCPGSAALTFNREKKDNRLETNSVSRTSELMQWPVQLRLINSSSPFLNNADILIAADCTAYAYGDFHKDFIKGKITLIACPKLDDNNYNKEKITEILKNNNIKSITVVRMEVPCCSGIVGAVKEAMINSKIIVPYNEVTISSQGVILK